MRGGEGAPLAPFGEELFEGDVFINFGGVANIGCRQNGWDINYCNLVLNYYAKEICGA
jgi:1,6-anhydro-N-acetylmuramate kinase